MYSQIYSSQFNGEMTIKAFLDSLPIPTIPTDFIEKIDAQLIKAEIPLAISSLQTGGGLWSTKCLYMQMIFCCTFQTQQHLYQEHSLSLLNQFGSLLGYKVNLYKNCSNLTEKHLPYAAMTYHFKLKKDNSLTWK